MTSNIKRLGTAGPGAGGQNLPFARAVAAGGFVFVSGQVAMKNGEIVPGGIISQTRQTVANLRAVLKEAGCEARHIVKINVWLDDPRDFWSFNRVFHEEFGEHPPARSTVASPLMVDAKIEMEAVAFNPESPVFGKKAKRK